MMRVTCSVSSYKYGHLLAHCIESLLEQTRQPDKIVVYDDGIGDCKHIKDIYDIEVVERPENWGIIKNFNDILQRVDTEYHMMIGADNWLRRDAIEKLMEDPKDINTYDIMVVGTGAKKFNDVVVGEERPEGYYWNTHGVMHGSTLYNTQMAQEIGYEQYSPGEVTQEDKYLFENMMRAGAERKHIAEPFLYYRRHAKNYNVV